LNKTFSGKTAEYLYAELIKANLAASNIENIDVIFDHFRQQYPDSKYVSWFTAPVLAVTQRQKQLLNDKMIFVADNGTKLNTFKDVLALTKGKTVLVDMWGTWCAPCREEIEKHSAALREAFKDKDLTFLYVANFDLNHEQEWKRLIAYFNLEGTHILANDGLTNNIMKAVKSNGYPTYILIKKDGTYALTKNQYPVDRQSMADELNEALAIKVQ
jgi:thiol-disulfide isomerase/thioredoxin